MKVAMYNKIVAEFSFIMSNKEFDRNKRATKQSKKRSRMSAPLFASA